MMRTKQSLIVQADKVIKLRGLEDLVHPQTIDAPHIKKRRKQKWLDIQDQMKNYSAITE